MSHFYAQIIESARKTQATARGHKNTGIRMQAASYSGGIEVVLRHNEETGKDEYQINEIPWSGAGRLRRIAKGILGE